MILALASVVNYDRQSDTPIWSITSSGVNYDRNKFIIQANGCYIAQGTKESTTFDLITGVPFRGMYSKTFYGCNCYCIVKRLPLPLSSTLV